VPRPKGSAELIEARRRQALRLLDEGYSLNEVGRIIGSAPSSVMRWRDAHLSSGEEAFKVRFSPGRPPALTAAQRKQIVKLLLKGATADGFSTELWTTGRVATLIQKHCRIQFHRSHVARLLLELGFSCQKHQHRARARRGKDRRVEAQAMARLKKTLRGWVPTSSLSMNPGSR
jgi:putative transposase